MTLEYFLMLHKIIEKEEEEKVEEEAGRHRVLGSNFFILP